MERSVAPPGPDAVIPARGRRRTQPGCPPQAQRHQQAARHLAYSDATFTLIDATTTNISGTFAGDSGAPYGNGGAFIGIHAALNPDLGETALTKAYNVAAELGGNFQY
jgi:hypothetical protein